MSDFRPGINYEEALTAERRIYDHCVDVHNLPDIFHYWSNRHMKPKLEAFGFSTVNDFFVTHLETQCRLNPQCTGAFVSLGSGNCDTEIEIARRLVAAGVTNFTLECVDLNPVMLERGRDAAVREGLIRYFAFTQSDFNLWKPACDYDAILANQSLHHVVNLEGLLNEVKRSLRPDGIFIVSDMIGRNGHQRWPEALNIVRDYWRRLPPSYRVNQALNRYEEVYQDWDCSVEGFEGIRAQDILPLLTERFHFHLFIPFGNIIDPFIDRAFGGHFDATSPRDRDFIDQVHTRDEREIAAGTLTPTHMLAVMANHAVASPRYRGGLTPQFCIRRPERDVALTPLEGPLYENTSAQWELMGHRLSQSEKDAAARERWAIGLEAELAERTAWALCLEADLRDRTALALRLDAELSEQTAWAVNLENKRSDDARVLGLERVRIRHLEQEIEARTAWALKLDFELEILRGEVSRYLHNPVRYLVAFLRAVVRRVKQ